MNNLEIKELIEKVKPYLKDYLSEQGINKKLFTCFNPDHPDKHPSMCYIENSQTVYCHACKCRYSIIDLIGIELGLGPHLHGKDFIEALKYCCQKYGIPLPKDAVNQPINYINKCYENRHKTDYFQKRGLTNKTINKFKLGFDENLTMANITMQAVIIPTSKTTFTARNIDSESPNRYLKSPGKVHLLNIEELYTSDVPIVITEGEFDALSLIEAGFKAISLSSTENIKIFIDEVIKSGYKSTLLLALDNDKYGKKSAEMLSDQLKLYHIRHKIINPYGKYKDANEMYLKDNISLTTGIAAEIRNSLKDEKFEQHCQEILTDYKKLSQKNRKLVDQKIKELNNTK